MIRRIDGIIEAESLERVQPDEAAIVDRVACHLSPDHSSIELHVEGMLDRCAAFHEYSQHDSRLRPSIDTYTTITASEWHQRRYPQRHLASDHTP